MVAKLSRVQEDRRLVTLRAMAEEAGRREDVYGALYDQGWQDALLHLTKILYPWHDGAMCAAILGGVQDEADRDRA